MWDGWRPESRLEPASSALPAASTRGSAAKGAAAGNTAARASAFLVVARGGPFLGRRLARRIDHFARAVERVPGAEHGRELPFALLAVRPRRPEWAEPALARQCQGRAALGRRAGARLVARGLVDARFGERLTHPPRTVAAAQEAAAPGPGIGGIVDVAERDVAADERRQIGLSPAVPAPLAQLAHEVALELRGAGGEARDI